MENLSKNGIARLLTRPLQFAVKSSGQKLPEKKKKHKTLQKLKQLKQKPIHPVLVQGKQQNYWKSAIWLSPSVSLIPNKDRYEGEKM